MIGSNGTEKIDLVKAHKMIKRIIELEKKNIQTRHYSEKQMVDKIKQIIREEADAYVN